MNAKKWKEQQAARATKSRAIRDRVDARSLMVRQSLARLKAGESVGIGTLLAQQRQELQDEYRRTTGTDKTGDGTESESTGREVAEAEDGGQRQGDG
jgi:hypothetical protein